MRVRHGPRSTIVSARLSPVPGGGGDIGTADSAAAGNLLPAQCALVPCLLHTWEVWVCFVLRVVVREKRCILCFWAEGIFQEKEEKETRKTGLNISDQALLCFVLASSVQNFSLRLPYGMLGFSSEYILESKVAKHNSCTAHLCLTISVVCFVQLWLRLVSLFVGAFEQKLQSFFVCLLMPLGSTAGQWIRRQLRLWEVSVGPCLTPEKTHICATSRTCYNLQRPKHVLTLELRVSSSPSTLLQVLPGCWKLVHSNESGGNAATGTVGNPQCLEELNRKLRVLPFQL